MQRPLKTFFKIQSNIFLLFFLLLLRIRIDCGALKYGAINFLNLKSGC